MLRFFFAHQAAFDRVGVGFVDVGQSAINQFAADVAQNHGHATRAEPLRNARAHHAGTDHGRVHHPALAGWRRLGAAFFVFLGQEKIPDQILARFRFTKIDNRIELAPQ